MARVVQRRGNPPYLLIFFVGLFLVAAALAVVFANNWLDVKKQRANALDERALLARPGEEQSPELAPLVGVARGSGLSVVTQLLQQRNALIKDLATEGTPFKQAQDLAAAAGPNGNLVGLVGNLRKQLGDAGDKLKQLQDQLAAAQAQLKGTSDALAGAQKNVTDQTADIRKQLDAKQKEFSDLQTQYNTSLEQAKKAWSDQLAEKDRRIGTMVQESQTLKTAAQFKDNLIAQLQDKLKRFQPPSPGETMTRMPDGRIIQAQADINVAYIDIGANDHVVVGLPFEVYDSKAGVTPDGRGKATLVVTNVYPTTAECRIMRTTKTQPIMPNDVIINVAFDATRSRTFVVEGDFDLNGDGHPDPMGSQRVRDLILQYGGKLADKVTVDTDFVVLGMEPVAPPASEKPTPQEEQIRAQLAKQADLYKNIEQEAKALQVPVLNTNRFLALIGYNQEVAQQ